MIAMKRGWMLVSVLLALLSGCAECAVAQAPLAVTTVQDTVYTASGAAASGTVLVSWPGFTTASGAVVPAGTETVTIGTDGLLSIALAPNAGATPIGSYYTATFHLSDGSTSREYWVVPVTTTGGPAVKLAAIQNDVLPTSVAMQTVSKTYVDMAIAAAVAGHPADSSTPYVLKAGDTMAGPLVLAGDPVSANQAADKNYVDENVSAITSGTARLPVFGASGTSHAQGVVPDPGATAGTTRYLREDGSWDTPPASGGGTMASQNANAVAITGGAINGATGTNSGMTVGIAANLAGGAANDIPYQTGAGVTGFIAPSNNAIFCTNGSGVPAWCTGVFETNGTANSSQSVYNRVNSTTNAAGLSETCTNTSGGVVDCEIAVSNAATLRTQAGLGTAATQNITTGLPSACFQLPCEVGSYAAAGLTAAVASATLVAVPSSTNGFVAYTITLNATCETMVSSAKISPAIFWTDSSNNSEYVNANSAQANCTTLGANTSFVQQVATIVAKSGTNVTYVASISGSPQYSVAFSAQQLTK